MAENIQIVSEPMVCKDCHFCGYPQIALKGKLVFEILLWCCYLVPGLLYTIWRRTNKVKVCEKCQGSNLIPANSPLGQQIIKEHEKKEA